MRKTDVEIAAEAIKYCKSELCKFNRLISDYEKGKLPKANESVYKSWTYEAQRLEYVLGLRSSSPTPPPWYE